jgi:hypothetical protein
VHATVDLIAFGEPYFDLHQEKDHPHRYLGSRHRLEDEFHDWYRAKDRVWTLADPFPSWLTGVFESLRRSEGPAASERHQAWLGHDHLDAVWDRLSAPDRTQAEAFLAWLLSRPDVLKSWAGVDVLNGRIHRLTPHGEIWEECPETQRGYQRLLRYVRAVKANNRALRDALKAYQPGDLTGRGDR